MFRVWKKASGWLSELFLPADRYGVVPFSVGLQSEMKNGNSSVSHTLEILNDNHTPMDYVAEVFRIKFELSKSDAVKKMFQVHQAGNSVMLTHSESVVIRAVKEIEVEAEAKGFRLKCRLVSLEK